MRWRQQRKITARKTESALWLCFCSIINSIRCSTIKKTTTTKKHIVAVSKNWGHTHRNHFHMYIGIEYYKPSTVRRWRRRRQRKRSEKKSHDFVVCFFSFFFPAFFFLLSLRFYAVYSQNVNDDIYTRCVPLLQSIERLAWALSMYSRFIWSERLWVSECLRSSHRASKRLLLDHVRLTAFAAVFTVWYCVKKNAAFSSSLSLRTSQPASDWQSECRRFSAHIFAIDLYSFFFSFASCASFLAHFFVARCVYAFSPATDRSLLLIFIVVIIAIVVVVAVVAVAGFHSHRSVCMDIFMFVLIASDSCTLTWTGRIVAGLLCRDEIFGVVDRLLAPALPSAPSSLSFRDNDADRRNMSDKRPFRFVLLDL